MVNKIINRAYYYLFTPFNLKDYHAKFGHKYQNIATNLVKRFYSSLNSGPISDLSNNITLDQAKS
jgi:hypothetical protein